MAARQHGVITLDQARICGLGVKAVTARVRHGAWRPVRRGVYAVGVGDPAPLGRILAAVAACPPGSLASHLTAAWLWGLLDRLPEILDVTVGGARNPGRLTGVHVHRATITPPGRWRHGVAVTGPTATLLDLAGVLDLDRLEATVAIALRKRLLTPGTLIEAVDHAGKRKGIAALRGCLVDPKVTRSGNERLLLGLIRAAELPEPQTNVVIGGKEVDVYWADARLAVEVDAFSTHGHEAAFEDDHVLDADFDAADIRIIRFTGRRIRASPYAIIARIAAVLALSLGGLPPPRRRR